MNNLEFDRLANSVLDGSASDDERAAFERHLRAEPAARERLAAWEDMFETLRSVPASEPPEGLHYAILRAIRSEPAPVPAWRTVWSSLFARRPAMTLAYATAFGIA